MIKKTVTMMCDRCKVNKVVNVDDLKDADYKNNFHHICDMNDNPGYMYMDYDLCNNCYDLFNKFMKGGLL